ncbi:MAG TPA: response regulator, partial [Candidatus Tectomicrobia bacterium]|nr:response regulator [Candidatus Tectomicrobia bacterium]
MTERVLVVDDDAEMATVVARHLAGEGLAATSTTSAAAAREALADGTWAVVVTDVVMDGGGGLELLRAVQQLQPDARVILMTAFGSLESAIEAIRGGAYDYLTKPFTMAELTLSVRRALDERRLRAENRRLRAEVERRYAFDALVARSP